MGSAWASRSAGLDSMVAYAIGSLRLPALSGNYEAWRFRYMVLITIVALATTSLISCCYSEEENPKLSPYEQGQDEFAYQIIQCFRNGFLRLSPRARRVCIVQFFSWMGWFGFLFYSTSFIAQLYIDEQLNSKDKIILSI